MNYRHAFHAGGPADVVKHAVLSRILVHLRDKPAAFRVIDTHAGAGLYDLRGPEAIRSPEWRDGIGRLLAAPVEGEARALLAPYLDAVAALNPGGELATYPGSPVLARSFLRSQDRLIACEIEPAAAAALNHNLGRERRAKAVAIDGWTALNAYLPRRSRRWTSFPVSHKRWRPLIASGRPAFSWSGTRPRDGRIPMFWPSAYDVLRSRRCCASSSISHCSVNRSALPDAG
jgi:23S rRNA A2030 N6-methylase RlmJ